MLRKLFKAGNYSRVEIICRNMVYRLSEDVKFQPTERGNGIDFYQTLCPCKSLTVLNLLFQAKIGVEAVALPRILSHPQPEQLRPSVKLSPNSTVNLLVSIWILINTEKDSKLTTGGPQIVRFLCTQGTILLRKPY